MRTLFSLIVAAAFLAFLGQKADAQVVVAGYPAYGLAGYSVPLPTPPLPGFVPGVAPVPVVSAYRVGYSAAPTRAASYATYRPAYAAVPAPIVDFPAPVVVAPYVARVRPAVVAPGIGGWPNVYVPGQPVRNALRYAIP